MQVFFGALCARIEELKSVFNVIFEFVTAVAIMKCTSLVGCNLMDVNETTLRQIPEDNTLPNVIISKVQTKKSRCHVLA